MLQIIEMLILAVGAIWLAKPAQAAQSKSSLEVVASVDLNRYAGKWYEIARLPNRFQRDCAGNTTASTRCARTGE